MSGRALDVAADLTVARGDGRSLRVTGDGATVVIAADGLRTLRDIGRDGSRARSARLAAALRRADVAVEVRVGTRVVATATPGRGAGWLGRLLGTSPFRPHLLGILSSWHTA